MYNLTAPQQLYVLITMHVCMHVYMYTIYIYIYMLTYVCVCTCMHIVCTFMHVSMYVCMLHLSVVLNNFFFFDINKCLGGKVLLFQA